MAVLGLVLGTMMQVLSGGLELGYRAGQLSGAVLKARVLMDELLADLELRDGVEEGVDPDGLRWRRTVRVATPEEGGPEEGWEEDFEHDFTLKYLGVEVAWNEGEGEKSYALHSLRVAPVLE